MEYNLSFSTETRGCPSSYHQRTQCGQFSCIRAARKPSSLEGEQATVELHRAAKEQAGKELFTFLAQGEYTLGGASVSEELAVKAQQQLAGGQEAEMENQVHGEQPKNAAREVDNVEQHAAEGMGGKAEEPSEVTYENLKPGKEGDEADVPAPETAPAPEEESEAPEQPAQQGTADKGQPAAPEEEPAPEEAPAPGGQGMAEEEQVEKMEEVAAPEAQQEPEAKAAEVAPAAEEKPAGEKERAAEVKGEGMTEGEQVEKMEEVAGPEVEQEPEAKAAEAPAAEGEPAVAPPPAEGKKEAAAAAAGGRSKRKRKPSQPSAAAAAVEGAAVEGGEGESEEKKGAVATPKGQGGKRGKKEGGGATKASNDYLEAVRAIPAGQTRTYTEVAVAAGRPNGARSVGKALKSLDLDSTPLPWHRVVGQDGKLQGEGSKMAGEQLRKLREEGARPKEEEAVVDWAKRVGAHAVGAYSYAAERFVFTDLDDSRIEEFSPERVEKFGSVQEAEERGFVRLSAMEVDE